MARNPFAGRSEGILHAPVEIDRMGIWRRTGVALLAGGAIFGGVVAVNADEAREAGENGGNFIKSGAATVWGASQGAGVIPTRNPWGGSESEAPTTSTTAPVEGERQSQEGVASTPDTGIVRKSGDMVWFHVSQEDFENGRGAYWVAGAACVDPDNPTDPDTIAQRMAIARDPANAEVLGDRDGLLGDLVVVCPE